MDGKGRFLDDVFVERLWRSLKHQHVYLHAWIGGNAGRRDTGAWTSACDRCRPTQTLQDKHIGRSQAAPTPGTP